jgi:hypothetical protein
MAFVNESYSKTALDKAFSGTAPAPARDRSRLLALSASLPGHQFITWNHATPANACAPQQHHQAKFSARAADTFADHYAAPLTYVLADYVRMPPGYIGQVYGPAFVACMQRLRRIGIVTRNTLFYLPHHCDLVHTIAALSSSSSSVVRAGENPLWLATNAVVEDVGYSSTNGVSSDRMFVCFKMQ